MQSPLFKTMLPGLWRPRRQWPRRHSARRNRSVGAISTYLVLWRCWQKKVWTGLFASSYRKKKSIHNRRDVVSDVEFEELHQSISALHRRTSYIYWRNRDEKIGVEKSTPRRFSAEAKLLFWYCHPKKLTAAMEVEDKVKMWYSFCFFFHSIES